MESCLVTGGAGHIGAHLVEALVAKGIVVHVLDALPLTEIARLHNVRDHIRYFQGSVLDLDHVRAATEEVDTIFHQPQAGSVVETIESSLAVNRTVVEGTLNVLQAARDNDVRRVIYGSSASIYGDGGPMPRSEDGQLEPISPHGVAILAGENYCVAFAHSYGLETVRLRYFNVYGPGQASSDERPGVLQSFLDAVGCGKRPLIFGDGMQTRDFVHVTDVVQANLLAADNPAIAGKAYNVGSGLRTTVIGLLGMIGRELDTTLRPMYTRARPGEIRFSHADISASQRDLGYCPCTNLLLDLPKLLGTQAPLLLRGPRFLDLHPSLLRREC
jgi:UDP-glucose 4-epimerase